MDRDRMNLYWKYVAEQNADQLLTFFHENGVICWHCTNEQFTVTEFIKVNCEYPGKWNGELERMEQIGDLIITVAHIWSDEVSCHVVSFFQMEYGKIKQLDEYCGDDGEIPTWRLDMKKDRPIL
ncbi:nuclear transport factor 2 family protein [Lacrimispora sp. 38-1]|uniref:nuclear transport factor 2 family protein n=1 Tax=Lacrimispora sp. 38-1 TaxID=3125778 RepID=UPI003CF291C1